MLNKFATASQKLSPGLRKVIGNTAWLFGEKIVQMGLGLLVGAWVARYLKPQQFGLFNEAIAFAALFAPFAKLGLDNIVVRDITRQPHCKNETLGTAFLLKLMGGILTSLLAVVMISLLRQDEPQLRWLVGIVAAVTVVQSFETIDFWFQSQVQSKYTVWARNGAYVLMNFVKIWLIVTRAPLITFAWAMLVESALSAVGMVIAYRLQGNFLKSWQVSFARAKVLLKDSWPLILSGLVIMIYMRIDQVMLGQMVGSKEVGVYSAAVKLSELWYFVPGAIVTSVFPSIVKAKEASEEIYYDRTQKLFNIMALLGYSVAIPITFLSTKLLTLPILYGKDYVQAGPILTVHIWAGLFVSLGVAREPWLISEGLMKLSAATTATGAVINVILNLFLIPRYGGMGAALATVIAQFTASYGANAIYPKTRIIFIKQTKAIFMIDVFSSLIKRIKSRNQ